MPALFSFLGTMVLASFNIFSILGTCGFFISSVHELIFKASKYSVLILYAVIGSFNYLSLYRNKYYEEVFDDFDKNGEKYKHWNLSVKLYIILSIAFMLCTLAIADLRNHGHI
jgi:hypothetical protein